MKKILILVVVLCGVCVAGVVVKWLIGYYHEGTAGLVPEMLFELPVEECGAISFSTNSTRKVWVTIGPNVNEMCRSRGFQSELIVNRCDSFFAVKGNKATRFVPEQFHSVKGDIEFEPANPDIVYFYQYWARYYPIVLQP